MGQGARPILLQYIRASQRDVKAPFWQSLYKLDDRSGHRLEYLPTSLLAINNPIDAVASSQ